MLDVSADDPHRTSNCAAVRILKVVRDAAVTEPLILLTFAVLGCSSVAWHRSCGALRGLMGGLMPVGMS